MRISGGGNGRSEFLCLW